MSEPVPQAAARVVVVTKAGCQLCEQAVTAVSQVCAEVGASWAQVDASDQPELADAYYYDIPVIFVDGRRHDYLRVDEQRLRAALAN